MFNKVKELYEMQKQAKQLQDMLSKESVIVQKGKVKIKIRGDQKIEWVEIDGEQDRNLTDAVNDAIKESQKLAAKKMRGQ
ncbi:hypothetical protein COS81_04865, partial [candidate division WWE3 bacterium CG06_land_8_20_14_3_00_42_16]